MNIYIFNDTAKLIEMTHFVMINSGLRKYIFLYSKVVHIISRREMTTRVILQE